VDARGAVTHSIPSLIACHKSFLVLSVPIMGPRQEKTVRVRAFGREIRSTTEVLRLDRRPLRDLERRNPSTQNDPSGSDFVRRISVKSLSCVCDSRRTSQVSLVNHTVQPRP